MSMENTEDNKLKDNQISERSSETENENPQMKELGVRFDGRYYWYEEYRYDLLSDALNYAKLDRFRARHRAEPSVQRELMGPKRPTYEEQQMMKNFGITYDGKRYHYKNYCYDEFVDAINYAKLKHR